jgi:uncharacterized membrane protein YhaH (DUF805 family)
MTNETATSTESPTERPSTSWFDGRSGRREYWLYCALLVGLNFAFREPPPIVGLIGTLVFIAIVARRLHDLGMSGWWGPLGLVAAPLAIALPIMWATDEPTAVAWSWPVGPLALLVFGVPRGQVHDNRFGPPPPFTARRVLTGR